MACAAARSIERPLVPCCRLGIERAIDRLAEGELDAVFIEVGVKADFPQRVDHVRLWNIADCVPPDTLAADHRESCESLIQRCLRDHPAKASEVGLVGGHSAASLATRSRNAAIGEAAAPA